MTLEEFKRLELLEKLELINQIGERLTEQMEEITEFLRDTWDD